MEKNAFEESPYFKPGDLVVGQSDPSKPVYSSSGTKLVEAGVKIYGAEKDIAAKRDIMLRAVEMHGGKAVMSQERKGKKNKKTLSQEARTKQSFSVGALRIEEDDYAEIPLVPNPPSLVTIQFENQFGKIKAKVEQIIEEELAFLLVFSNEDMVVFEPKIGETLSLYTATKQKFEVYYPGVTFHYPPDKRLMVLFKIPDETDLEK
jgi:hypothetical protein